MKLSQLKINPNNPRIIKDERFDKLVKSIKDFPKMMKLRPIIVDNDNMVLGGNMRLKALQQLGFKEIPDEWIKRADELTEDEKNEFIIKDNIGFGEHDWDILANDWDSDKLVEWGLDLYWTGSEFNSMNEGDLDLDEEFNPIGLSKGLCRIVFILDNENKAKEFMKLNHNELDYKVLGNNENKIYQINLSENYGK